MAIKLGTNRRLFKMGRIVAFLEFGANCRLGQVVALRSFLTSLSEYGTEALILLTI